MEVCIIKVYNKFMILINNTGICIVKVYNEFVIVENRTQ